MMKQYKQTTSQVNKLWDFKIETPLQRYITIFELEYRTFE